jgi:hypothetical protein
MVINIIKGAGALFLVIVICHIASIALMMATDKRAGPDFAVAFAWLGTVPAMFCMGTGFWRRLMASLLGSIASIAARFGFAMLTGALLSAGILTEEQSLLVVFGPFVLIANFGQLAIAYFVARALVRWGSKKPANFATA